MWWHGAEASFRLSAKRTSPFKSAGRHFSPLLGAEVCASAVVMLAAVHLERMLRAVIKKNAGNTMFRGSVKSTGYPLYSPFSPSLSLSCVTVCHHISTALYLLMMDLDTPETCRGLWNILRISCASSWFLFTRLYRDARSRKRKKSERKCYKITSYQ